MHPWRKALLDFQAAHRRFDEVRITGTPAECADAALDLLVAWNHYNYWTYVANAR